MVTASHDRDAAIARAERCFDAGVLREELARRVAIPCRQYFHDIRTSATVAADQVAMLDRIGIHQRVNLRDRIDAFTCACALDFLVQFGQLDHELRIGLARAHLLLPVPHPHANRHDSHD